MSYHNFYSNIQLIFDKPSVEMLRWYVYSNTYIIKIIACLFTAIKPRHDSGNIFKLDRILCLELFLTGKLEPWSEKNGFVYIGILFEIVYSMCVGNLKRNQLVFDWLMFKKRDDYLSVIWYWMKVEMKFYY